MFYMSVVRQMALDNMPFRNGASSQIFDEETYPHIFLK